MSYADYEMRVIQWGEARGIVQNSTVQAQLLKTVEELGELISAVRKKDAGGTTDGFGDVLVTLILAAAIADVDLVKCLEWAYDEIKDRKGFLNSEGVFMKEGN